VVWERAQYRGSRCDSRLLSDNLGGAVKLLIQRALFFAAQATAMRGCHIAFFLLDRREPLMEPDALGRRIVALGDMCINAVRFVIKTLFDLLGAMQGRDMRIGWGRWWRCNDAGGQQTAAGSKRGVLNDLIHRGIRSKGCATSALA